MGIDQGLLGVPLVLPAPHISENPSAWPYNAAELGDGPRPVRDVVVCQRHDLTIERIRAERERRGISFAKFYTRVIEATFRTRDQFSGRSDGADGIGMAPPQNEAVEGASSAAGV